MKASEKDSAALLPPLKHAPHSGCLNCGSIPWLGGESLSEAIPPHYTEWIGAQLLGHIREEVAA